VLVYCAVETGNNISEAITSINQKNSSLSGTEYDETSECLHSGENVGTFSIFYELYFRFYYIVVLRSETSVACVNGCVLKLVHAGTNSLNYYEHPLGQWSPNCFGHAPLYRVK
jgi:hypothetical protein